MIDFILYFIDLHWKKALGLLFVLIGLYTMRLVFRPLKKTKKYSQKTSREPKVSQECFAPMFEKPHYKNSIKKSPPKSVINTDIYQEKKVEQLQVKTKNTVPAIFSMPSNVVWEKEGIKEKILFFLQVVEENGAEKKRILGFVWSQLKGELPQFDKPASFIEVFDLAFLEIKNARTILYDKTHREWYVNPEYISTSTFLIPLSDKERRYFKVKQLGTGWFRLGKEEYADNAIAWIHQNFTPDEFEQFCCAILSHHSVIEMRISEKRASGADGGIDGLGKYSVDGVKTDILMQAKRYKYDNLVQEQHIRDFIGALVTHDVKYGFFITTSTFTNRAKEVVNKLWNAPHKPKIQLLDAKDIIECMIYRGDANHGYGLHKSDELEIFYLNPDMLRAEIKKFS